MFSQAPEIIQPEQMETRDAISQEDYSLEPVALGAALLEVGLWISRTNGLPAPAGLHKSMAILQDYLDMDGPTLRRLEIFGQALLATRPEIDHVARRVHRIVQAGHQQLVVKYVRRVSSSQQWRSASIRAPKQSVHVPVTLVKATGIPLQGEAIPPEPLVPPRPSAPPLPVVRLDHERLHELTQQTAEVQRLLATHLDAEMLDAPSLSVVSPISTIYVDKPVQPITAPSEHTGLVDQAIGHLKAQALWSVAEMAALARKLGVFPGKLIEAVNSWSNERFNDDLIYDDDPYEIQLDLLVEGA